MRKITKPRPIEIPDAYSLKISPGKTVKTGTSVSIAVTYTSGMADRYAPALEIVRAPNRYPSKPEEFGRLVEKEGKVARFEFVADALGTYGLRLRPFGNILQGEFIEIHTMTGEEEAELLSLWRNRVSQQSNPTSKT